uniref:C-type lectin domain-containing protein n=1 Tax=Acrobeloides nanus TaxID=290746 RepID=A0A914C424_9BILA
MAINAPPYKCGDGYCEESICTGGKNGCYYYGSCIQGQCIYWDISVKQWKDAKTICHDAGATLVAIPNQEFQEEIYGNNHKGSTQVIQVLCE